MVDTLLEGKGGKAVKMKKIKDQIANINARYDAELEGLTQSFNETYPATRGEGGGYSAGPSPQDELSNLQAIADEAGMELDELLTQISEIE